MTRIFSSNSCPDLKIFTKEPKFSYKLSDIEILLLKWTKLQKQ